MKSAIRTRCIASSVRASRFCFALGLIAAASLWSRPVPARGQLAIPPSVLKQQADRERDRDRDDNNDASSHAATNPSSTTRPSSDAGSATRRKQIQALSQAALSDDPAASVKAVKLLRGLGDPARTTLRDVVRQLLAKDRAALEAGGSLPSGKELRDLSDKIQAERQAARENIDKLAHDSTIDSAHRHYDALKEMWTNMHGALAKADAVSRALSRRPLLLNIYRDLNPSDKQYSDDSEAKLAAKAEKGMGMPAERLAGLAQLRLSEPPADPVLRDIWFYHACRQIESYNAKVAKTMTEGEAENAFAVNMYREYLGILPYELDSRLIVSARAHSHEMVDMKYFAHESPVAENKTPWDRIRKAGYGQGSGENIAFGSDSGERTFWQWFDSPGHHQNIARQGNTALGVGQVGNMWTQNMGAQSRQMAKESGD